MTQGYVNSLKICIRAYWKNESGGTAIEYALMAALIGVGIIGGLNAFGDQTNGAWQAMADAVANAV